MALSSKQIAASLELQPHPEGGYFKETFRDTSVALTKSVLPPELDLNYFCIYNRQGRQAHKHSHIFLLPSGNVSLLHRIPCAETWHFYLGEPLTVFELQPNGGVKQTILGPDLAAGQKLQYTVPPFVWFGSYPTKDVESFSADGSLLVKAPPRDPETHYSLVGCTCAPAFQFQDFELASRPEILPINSIAKPFIEYLTPSD